MCRRLRRTVQKELRAMSIFAVISYPDQGSAGEAVAALKWRQKEFLIELEDVAWVIRSQDGMMKLRQGTSLTGAGSASSAFWGFLFGLFFLVANRGMDAGSAMSAAAGYLSDCGFDDKWVKTMANAIPVGGSALFVMTRTTSQERALPEMAKLGGTLLRTYLTPRQQRALEGALQFVA